METENKAVLISIQPKWCELIANGEKTIEVRKTKPKLKPPFKCYIYCTKDKNNHFWTGKRYSYADDRSHNAFDKDGNGKVIGEFVCDTFILDRTYGHDPLFYGAACMNAIDVAAYALNNPMYGWHISDLKIYDEPQELSEFEGLRKTKFGYEPIEIKKAPRNWCYVEEVKSL